MAKKQKAIEKKKMNHTVPKKGQKKSTTKGGEKKSVSSFHPAQLLQSLLGKGKKSAKPGVSTKGKKTGEKNNKMSAAASAKPSNAKKTVKSTTVVKSAVQSGKGKHTDEVKNLKGELSRSSPSSTKKLRENEKNEITRASKNGLSNEIDLDDRIVKTMAAEEEDDQTLIRDASGRPYCKVKDCDQVAVVDGYCRYHYLLLWKKIQVRRKILADGKLERYIEELTARYPDKYLDVIRKDLLNEKTFLALIAEMEIDESAEDNEFESEDTQTLDEVRGYTESSIMGEEDF